MRISTSYFPTLVWYTNYEWCKISEALLRAFIDAPDNLLTLPAIGNIKVNWNRLLGSYWSAIRDLRKQGYKITTITKHHKNHITTSEYKLTNPLFNPTK